MNLDTQDIALIGVTVEASVGKAMAFLVTKEEFRSFRLEVLDAHKQFYTREMVDQLLSGAREERSKLTDRVADLDKRVEEGSDVVQTLWSNMAIKVGLFVGVALQCYELYRLVSGH